MRSARLSTASRGSMLALAIASAVLPAALLLAQAPTARIRHPGAILVQAMDTSINPLAAEIVLPAFGLGARLSDEGIALFSNVPDGMYLVQARSLGYRPEWRVVRIAGDTARIDFVLPPASGAHGIAGSIVGGGLAESRLREFLRRSASIQMASFVTRADIERRHPRNLVALLGRIPEVTTDRAGPGPTVVRSKRVTQRECASGMLLFVDGMLPSPPPIAVRLSEVSGDRATSRWLRLERVVGGATDASRWSTAATARELAGVEPVMPGGPTSARRGPSPLDWVPISLVAGVEIYPIVADVPPEFRVAGAECGVVLVWTLRR
jgi:hypothetical protein